MKNIILNVKDNTLTITVDLSKTYGRSKSGKSTIIASSEGNLPIPGKEEVKFGLNVYSA